MTFLLGEEAIGFLRFLYGLELGSSGREGVTYKSFLGEEAIGFFVVFWYRIF